MVTHSRQYVQIQLPHLQSICLELQSSSHLFNIYSNKFYRELGWDANSSVTPSLLQNYKGTRFVGVKMHICGDQLSPGTIGDFTAVQGSVIVLGRAYK
jgi:hypothetical protein